MKNKFLNLTNSTEGKKLTSAAHIVFMQEFQLQKSNQTSQYSFQFTESEILILEERTTYHMGEEINFSRDHRKWYHKMAELEVGWVV